MGGNNSRMSLSSHHSKLPNSKSKSSFDLNLRHRRHNDKFQSDFALSKADDELIIADQVFILHFFPL